MPPRLNAWAGFLRARCSRRRDQPWGDTMAPHAPPTSRPPSPEYDALDAELRKIIKAKQKRTPNDRHDMRVAALYVEPISETRWNRPADTSPIVAFEFLREAVNDYSIRCHNSEDAILKRTAPEL